MVDAADREKVEASRNELHNLLEKPQLQGIPVGACRDPCSPEMHDFNAAAHFLFLFSKREAMCQFEVSILVSSLTEVNLRILALT